MAHGNMKKLPEDVVIDILLRLPVKSLMKLKCVSNTWYILIGSSTFINCHLNSNTVAKEEFILFKRSFMEEPYRYKTILSFLSGDDDYYLNALSPDLDVSDLISTFNSIYDQFIGPCHGLIALMNILNTILINPATRNYRLIPPCPFACPPGFRRDVDCIGFGFDTISNDYKVVRISEIYWDTYYMSPDVREKKVEVYGLSFDSWRELEHVGQDLPIVHWMSCSMIFYKVACHWLAIVGSKMVILCFDMSTETFRNMILPNTCNYFNGPRYGLVILNESLSMICYPDQDHMSDPAHELMDIWIMSEYSVYDSWIKKYSIGLLPIDSLLAVWKDYSVLLECDNGHLISCDIKSGKVKAFNFDGFPKSLRAIT
ncbi:F-box protein CPR1-like [Nicotiana tabacum]|uniref:F-box protein CPR1-like n=1 Tax=Nicotiana tabacum TaxID=4097 RepID=A0A1S4CNF0_TOBAC|nr:PREDICTED: F-box protein CPR30-like [Nicotiana tabacum]